MGVCRVSLQGDPRAPGEPERHRRSHDRRRAPARATLACNPRRTSDVTSRKTLPRLLPGAPVKNEPPAKPRTPRRIGAGLGAVLVLIAAASLADDSRPAPAPAPSDAPTNGPKHLTETSPD